MSAIGSFARALGSSPYFQPVLATVAGSATVLVVRRVTPFVAGWAVLFAVAIALDALHVGQRIALAGTTWAQAFAIFFVILGDFRGIWLVERMLRPEVAPWPVALRAAGLAFVVPMTQRLVAPFLPANELRVTFLSYEVLFFSFGSVYALHAIARRARSGPEEVRKFVRRILGFLLVQYAAWALADVLILLVPGGADMGAALRIFPNFLYYGAFVPFAYALAPARLRR